MKRLLQIALTIFTGLLLIRAVPAQPAPAAQDPEPGQFITVGNPITSPVVIQIREAVARAEQRRPLRKIIFDFNPDGKPAATADIGPCLDLARFIKERRNEGKGLLTVAFVRNKLTRHSVLPVLACDEVLMAPDAVLGPVASDAATTPDRNDLLNYESFAKPEQAALILKMLDSHIDVLEGSRNRAVWYVDGRKEAEAIRDGVVIGNRTPVLAAGTLAAFRAVDARRFQLCKAIVANRQQVEELYNMPPGSYREDPLMDRQRVAWRLIVRREINGGLESSLKRQIDRAVKRGGNLLFLQLECGAGSAETARDLAEHLRTLKGTDNMPVMTVAFIPHAAADNATFLALGCNEIVMARSARLGDFSGWLNPPARRGPAAVKPDLVAVRDSLVQLAESQGYSPLLVRGLFDEDLEIVRAKRKKGAIEELRLMTPDQLEEKEDGQLVWDRIDTVKHPGKLLVITGDTAMSLGFARYVVDKAEDINEVFRHYAVEPGQVREAGPDWLDNLASFLADPFVSAFLVLVGISCLILELKMPGASLPGIIAAICFVLFFWAQSQLNGQITLLAVLLFLLGLVLLGLEILVIPGFGIVGISGVGLMLFGLGLATVERMPQTSAEWSILGYSMTKFSVSLVGAIAVAFTVARYLPHIPIVNRLVLIPPEEAGEPDPMRAAHAAEQLALLGAIGTSATMLRPAGMAQFGERFVDVITDGSFVPAGSRVQVIEIEGNRVVVKEV